MRVSSATRPRPLSTCDTVVIETLARRATSLMFATSLPAKTSMCRPSHLGIDPTQITTYGSIPTKTKPFVNRSSLAGTSTLSESQSMQPTISGPCQKLLAERGLPDEGQPDRLVGRCEHRGTGEALRLRAPPGRRQLGDRRHPGDRRQPDPDLWSGDAVRWLHRRSARGPARRRDLRGIRRRPCWGRTRLCHR